MIPVLFEKGTTDFNNSGIGILSDTISCVATEERNGPFGIKLTYLMDGMYANELKAGRIIYAKSSHGKSPQPFYITRLAKSLDGIEVNADHVCLTAARCPIPVISWLGLEANAMLSTMINLSADIHTENESTGYASMFTAMTDISGTASLSIESPTTLYAGFKAVQNAFGGDFDYDGYTVWLLRARGTEKPITIRYGQNITAYNEEFDISGAFGAVYPYAKYTVNFEDGASVEFTAYGDVCGDPAYGIVSVDFSDRFDDVTPTPSTLNILANEYLSAGLAGVLDKNISVSFAGEDSVEVGDTITVFHELFNTNVKMQVVRLEYDSINERILSCDLGKPKTNLAEQIKTVYKRIDSTDKNVQNTNDRIDSTNENLGALDNDFETACGVAGIEGHTPTGKVTISNSEGITIYRYTGADSSWGNEKVFYADIDGNLTLKGTINANAGTIGPWQIGQEGLYAQNSAGGMTRLFPGHIEISNSRGDSVYIDPSQIAVSVAGLPSAFSISTYGEFPIVNITGYVYVNGVQIGPNP